MKYIVVVQYADYRVLFALDSKSVTPVMDHAYKFDTEDRAVKCMTKLIKLPGVLDCWTKSVS